MRIYGDSDYAVTADGGDYTVHFVVGMDPEGRMYLLDHWRKQSSSDEWIEAFCNLVPKWKPMAWAEEKGQISAGVGPALDKRQRERKAYWYREQFRTWGQGGESAIHSRPHGAGRPLRAHECALVY